jgi:hypothetical protein
MAGFGAAIPHRSSMARVASRTSAWRGSGSRAAYCEVRENKIRRIERKGGALHGVAPARTLPAWHTRGGRGAYRRERRAAVTSTAAMLTEIATAWVRAFSAGDFFSGKTECGDPLGKIVTDQFHASQVLRRSAIHVALLSQPEHFLPF